MNAKPDERAVFLTLPKVDLHRHLEGSVRLQTCLELARAVQLPLPTESIESLRPYVQFVAESPDFHRFLGIFDVLDQLYDGDPNSVARVAREAVLDAASDQVFYLELRFNPDHFARRNGSRLDDVTRWVTESAQGAAGETGTGLRFIITVPRNYALRDAEKLVQIAVDFQSSGICGLDLAGDEIGYPWQPFVPLFREAAQAGLPSTIHAGEVGPPENVAAALTQFGARRIGHGVAIAGDDRVMSQVRAAGATLEVCPTSNLQTGAFLGEERKTLATAADYPLPDLFRKGVRVTLNTDDPSISGITLTGEYAMVHREMGVSLEELRQIMMNGVEAAFLSDQEKRTLSTRLQEAWNAAVADS